MNMKKFKFLVVCMCLVSVLFLVSGCKEVLLDDCGGYGTLKLTNTSSNTIQRIQVDGVNYGTLDPGEDIEIDLPVGRHTVEFINVRTGNYACSPMEVIIVECDTQGFSCGG